jgi:selenocysteine-specific elongation factor
MHIVIGTAGHIDHGKSALVKALTGTDPDRLKEEKERGMTTDLGFAFYSPAVTIIDVPGHERFVRHMLAGATTIDLVMLVIAADDGIMPQTREHFEITRLLGIKQGIVVINKCDLVDDEWLAMVRADTAALVQGSYLEQAPVLAVSSLTGAGIPELKAAIEKLVARAPAKADRGIFRLPIDRNFTMKGFGTVVAGTVLSGSVRAGDQVELLGASDTPEGLPVRIRGIQVHNRPVPAAALGERAALNLQGIERETALRGSVLATPGYYKTTEFLNVSFYHLRSAPGPLKNMTRLRLHLGTAEIMCRAMLLDEKELAPGQEAMVQLRLETPAVADWGDRYVLRTYSPQRTIGGGTVLEANPGKARRFDAEVVSRLKAVGLGSAENVVEQQMVKVGLAGRSRDALAHEVALNPADTARVVDELLAAGKLRQFGSEGKLQLIHAGALARARSLILDTLAAFHRQNPVRLGMKRQELRSKLPSEFGPVLFDASVSELQREGRLAADGEKLRLAEHTVKLNEPEQELADRVEAIYDEAGFNSPGLAELRADLGADAGKRLDKVLTALLEMGRIVDVGEGVVLGQRHVQAAEQKTRELFARQEQMTASEFRQMIDTSRKYAIPLLNYFDSHGLTQRRGDVRVLRK